MAYGHACRTFRLFLLGTSFALALSACGSSGSTRIASIGSTPGDTASNGGGGDTSSGGGGSGDPSSGGSGGGTGGSSGGGSSGGGTGGSSGGSTPLGGPLLVTAGNAVIGLGDKHAGLASVVNGKVAVAGPITGTVTAVLHKTGQTLVDLGNGRSAVLNKAGGAVGKLVTIDLGTGRVIGAPGATGLLGVAALTPTQLASVAVANPATGASTGVLGKVGTITSGATGVLGGNGALGGVLGNGTATPTPQTGGLIPAVTTVTGGLLGKAKPLLPKH